LKTKVDGHAGEQETSHTMISRPDLVHLDRAGNESGSDRNRLDLPLAFTPEFGGTPNSPSITPEMEALQIRRWAEFDMKN